MIGIMVYAEKKRFVLVFDMDLAWLNLCNSLSSHGQILPALPFQLMYHAVTFTIKICPFPFDTTASQCQPLA